MPRRLPVIQSEPESESRPAWQWVPIGAGFCFSIWLPLLMLAQWVSARWLDSLKVGTGGAGQSGALSQEFVLAAVLPNALSLALAFLLGGALVSRGGPGSATRHAVLAGGLCGVLVAALGFVGGATGGAEGVAVLLVLVSSGAVLSGLGAVLARRRK